MMNSSLLNESENYNNLIDAFVTSTSDDLRVKLLKKIASKKEKSSIGFLDNIVKSKNYSEKVRREAVSAVGRLRDYEIASKYLIDYSKDLNPEIVLQAIRGLLVFKNDLKIKKYLKTIALKSKNEIIQNVLNIEFNPNKIDFDSKSSHIVVDDKYKDKVVLGDALKMLSLVDENSVHLTFTSPPYYNARDYSIYGSYNEYLDFLDEIFKEVHRVTKDGRFLVVNTSPVIIPRAGRKYSSFRYPIPYDLHARLVASGWDFVDDIHWVKPDASVKNRIGGFLQFRKPLMYKPNSVTEQVMVYRKKSNRLIDWSIKAYPSEIVNESLIGGDFFKNNIWNIDPVFDKVHSAVFPYELCRNIVRYYSFKGDLVFDPFAGSGTLAKAALDNNRHVLMSEISEEYYQRIFERLEEYQKIEFLNIDEFG